MTINPRDPRGDWRADADAAQASLDRLATLLATGPTRRPCRPVLAAAAPRHATEPGMPGRTVPDARHLEPVAPTPWAAILAAGVAGALGGALVSSAWWLW